MGSVVFKRNRQHRLISITLAEDSGGQGRESHLIAEQSPHLLYKLRLYFLLSF